MKYFIIYGKIFSIIIFSVYLISCGSENYEPDNYQLEVENPDIEGGLQINVATYNLRRDGSEDNIEERLWINRKEYVKKIIKKYDFDIFGTQEGFQNQLLDILELGNYAYIGVGRDDSINEGEHTAIFYKTDKFEVLDKGNFWLSETPNVPSWGWNASKRRVCSWGRFKEKETGKIFLFVNTHYDTVGSYNRLESTKLVLKKIEEISSDSLIFFTGDLNALPSEESIQLLSSLGKLQDSRLVSVYPATGTEGTAHGYNLDGTISQRIDYIFVSKAILLIQYCVINDDIELGKFSSDHFPVMSKVKL
mgnify:CR=1 FL=1